MLGTLTFLFAILALYFWVQQRNARKIVSQMANSIKEGKSLILERPILLSEDFPLSQCQRTIDENATKLAQLQNQESKRTHAFNEILGGMLDGAIILDGNHVITFANSTAVKNFSLGRKMVGRRLEAIIDSVEALDLLDQLARGKKPGKAEFSFRKNGTPKDFEVATALLSPIRATKNEVFLLLFREVTEIKKTERLRKDFVANASHELRTPVTLIKGFAESLVDSPDLPSNQQKSFTEKILKNSLRLQALVDDLLNLSELEGSEEPITLTNNKLSDIIKGIDLYLQDKPYIDSSKLSFAFADEKDGFPMDAIKIAMAVGNLIDNAFKYAGDFSKVSVSTQISEDGDKIICSVRDDGNGIPKKDLEQIFERFYVVDKGRSREKGGTGLGLSIVKNIVEAHGGKVMAESTIGEGSCFSIVLPRVEENLP
jgi:two-component system phosphate regulon sensor histidine kinase PhoR